AWPYFSLAFLMLTKAERLPDLSIASETCRDALPFRKTLFFLQTLEGWIYSGRGSVNQGRRSSRRSNPTPTSSFTRKRRYCGGLIPKSLILKRLSPRTHSFPCLKRMRPENRLTRSTPAIERRP